MLDGDLSPAVRGYVLTYRSGMACPGCGRLQWHVGRLMAECASCTTALPLNNVERKPANARR